MSNSPLPPGQALVRWLLQVTLFVIAGGVAAGTSALLYETVSTAENPVVLYGIVFAAGGGIASPLSGCVLNGA